LYQRLLRDASFLALLLHIDDELCGEARSAGCPVCGGVVHSARFPRKPRGGPWPVGDEHASRLSLCCAVEGCRKRVTPPSVRFLGRRVYLGAVVVLAGVMLSGPTPWRVSRLGELLGVSRRTLVRWRTWWRETFPATGLFRELRGRLRGPAGEGELPGDLLARLRGDAAARLIAVLRLLCPLSAVGHAR
jgi:hypothetical protein